MFKSLLVLIALVAGSPYSYAEIKIPASYVQQNQHTSFHVFGNGEQSLISHCFFVEQPEYGRCYLNFKTPDSYNIKNIFFDYDILKEAQHTLLKKLKTLQSYWQKNYPVTAYNQYIFIFRQADHDVLANHIRQIEAETLSNRFLMSKIPRDIESIYSSKLIEEIFKAYEDTFAPYELR